jgi:spore germination cell wall hydrolase CwlJ-like protein
MKIIQKTTNIFAYLLIAIMLVYSVTRVSSIVTTNYIQKTASSEFNKELECLAKNIYYEAGIEPYEGKLAVAQVTINRSESGKFPSKICDVVYQRKNNLCQFSWTCMQVTNIRNKYRWEESLIVAKKALTENNLHDIISQTNALYYHANYVNPGWNKKQIVAKIGNHTFYRTL